MARLVLMRPIHFPPGREDVGLAWLREAMAQRLAAGMIEHAIMRRRSDRHEYVAMMVWPNAETYTAWHGSPERQQLFANQPHYIVREPTRRFTELDPQPADL